MTGVPIYLYFRCPGLLAGDKLRFLPRNRPVKQDLIGKLLLPDDVPKPDELSSSIHI
jgi:hypothetical protein